VTAGKTGLIDTEAAYDGDRGQIRTSTELRIMAALRNAAIGALRTAGITNIAVVGHASPAPFRTATTGSASGGQSPGGDGSAAATTSGTLPGAARSTSRPATGSGAGSGTGCGRVRWGRRWTAMPIGRRSGQRMSSLALGRRSGPASQPPVRFWAHSSLVWSRSRYGPAAYICGQSVGYMTGDPAGIAATNDGQGDGSRRRGAWTRSTMVNRSGLGCAGKRAKAGGCLSSCLKVEQVRAHVEVSKRGPKGSRTRPFSCINVVEAQGDLDGRIHPRTAPHVDAWP
jgi:hypothetical protein